MIFRVILFCCAVQVGFGQPIANFQIQPSVCKNENLQIANQSTGASKYDWDFCANDFAHYQSIEDVVAIPAFLGGFGYSMIEDGGKWYGFVLGQVGSWLYRLDFGDSPLNVPQVVSIGNPGNVLNQPQGIDFIKHSGGWSAFVGHVNASGSVVRLDFGTSLTSQPTATALGNFGQSGMVVWDLKAVENNNNLLLLLANRTDGKIVTVNYHNSYLNTPGVSDIQVSSPIPNASTVLSLDAVQIGDEWKVLVTSYFNDRLIQLNYNNDLFADFSSVDQLTFANSVKQPVTIRLIKDGNSTLAMVGNNQSEYGTSLINLGDFTGIPTEVQTTLPVTYSFEGVRLSGVNYIFALGSSSTLKKMTFENQCGASVSHATQFDPGVIKYNLEGSKDVRLSAIDENNVRSVFEEVVVVNNATSPDITISHGASVCAGVAIDFEAVSAMGNIADCNWTFGDGSNSTGSITSHTYSVPGNYDISLHITGTNGCSNFAKTSKQIFAPPQASFTMPPLLCTNTEVTFANTTADSYPGLLNYEWYVDLDLISVQRDLNFKFEGTASRDIKLVTTIPGCSSTLTEAASNIMQGAAVDFTTVGNCEDHEIRFQGVVSEAIISQEWNFDDGQGSELLNPVHIFESEGLYEITLAVQSANGCITVQRKQFNVHNTPVPDFAIQPQPSSCTGSPSQFNDLTEQMDGGIESWFWDFGDNATDTNKHPSHTFQNAGEYNIQLTVTTDLGCSNSIVKPVTILQSPSISIEHGATCFNNPVDFAATSDDAVQYYWEINTSYYENQNVRHVFGAPGSHVVKLSVLGENNCVSTLTRNITIPTPIDPVFTVTNNCKDFESRFSSSIESTDPVVTRSWNFGGERISTDVNPSHRFSSSGDKFITLQVTTTSGCVYQRKVAIPVLDPPIAAFSFTPSFGVPPQEISFINTSTNATTFNWDFGDGTTSIEKSPNHTFSELGDYSVKLTSSNSAGCESIIQKSISMVAPLPDVDLNLMTITPNNDGTFKVIITIENKGNTFLRDLPVKLDVSGAVTIETIVDETIAPFSFYNLVMDFAIAKTSNLEFLCASATLNGDLHPEGNRICEQLNSRLAVITPHPNPVSDFILLEWIAAGSENIEVELTDLQGKTVLSTIVTAEAGLNRSHVDVKSLRSGTYILRIVSPTRSETHRILISH